MSDNAAAPLKRILVVRTDRIGDVLLSTPVLSGLRAHCPGAYLAMLVSPYAREVVEGHPALNAVLEDDRTGRHRGIGGFLRLVRHIRAHRFDAAVVLHSTWRLALLSVLAGIPIRVGAGYRVYGPLFNFRVYEHRKDAKRHEVEYNLRMIEALGVPASSRLPHITLTTQDRDRAEALWRGWAIRSDERVAALHPGSGGSAREWPPASFAALGDRLTEDGVRVIITGGPDERALVDEVVKRMRTAPLTLAGETRIKELAAVLDACDVCVANSTGPLHLAAAVGTPAVALFCPITPCSPTRWGPYGEGHRVLQPDVPACPRCIHAACPYWDCMTRIPVDAVYAAVQDALKTRPLRVGGNA